MRPKVSLLLLFWLPVLVSGCGGCNARNAAPANAEGDPAPHDKPADAGDEPARLAKKPLSDDPSRKRYLERVACMHEAVEGGQISRVEELLKEGMNVNDKDANGETPLMKAVGKGHHRLTLVLLLRGADPVEKDGQGETALMKAAAGGQEAVVELLLAGNAPPEALQGLLAQGKELGLDLKVPGTFKLNPVDLNVRDKNGQTALMKAVANSHRQVVQLLLDKKADHGLTDKQGRTALMLALAKGWDETSQLLLQRYSTPELLRPDAQGETALALVLAKAPAEQAEKLLLRCDSPQYVGQAISPTGVTPLMFAASKGYVGTVEKMLTSHRREDMVERAKVLGLKDGAGKTAEQLADENGHKEVVALLRLCADVDGKDANGQTPLMKAAARGDLAAVERLRRLQADLDLQDEQGRTAAMLAAAGGNVKVLNAIGFSLTATDKEGRTVLMHAAANGHPEVTSEVLGKVANQFHSAGEQWITHLECKDKGGRTALQLAEAAGHGDTTGALLRRFLKDHLEDSYSGTRNLTALQLAAYHGDLKTVQALLALGANRKGNRSGTPLMLAAERGHLDVVRALLDSFPEDQKQERSAYMKMKIDGDTALELARKNERQKVVELLSQYEAK
jgi:ankyrin repeat protein